jgi:hypothetical protein
MTDRPQTWHYGLVARWWAEFNTDGPEIECLKVLSDYTDDMASPTAMFSST